MDFKYIGRRLLLLTLFLASASLLFAQTTTVSGTVTDARNKQPMSFVTITFIGSTVGINTDKNGKYTISTDKPVTQLRASFIGYKDVVINVAQGQTQTFNIKLVSESKQLSEVTVKSAKKAKYRNKGNPAVELIRLVIANREKNRPESYNYVEYKEYDKMQFSVMNVSDKFADRSYLRKYKFFFDNRDSTTVPGKSLLPIFLDEKVSQYYYRKNPEREKTTTLGEKTIDYGGAIDQEGVNGYFKHMYYKVDIYDNSIFLMTNNFLSPIANGAPTFYKYFIADTIVVNNQKLIELNFTPRNLNDMLFEGTIFITLDGNYAVQKANLEVNKNINLNFVKGMHVNQEFEQNPDGRYHLSKSITFADFGLNKKKNGGLYGIRTIVYKNYQVNVPRPDTTYKNSENAVSEAAKNRSEAFWQQNRLDTLTTAEMRAYKNTDSLKNMKSFQNTLKVATFLFAGYWDTGPFEIGPSNAFYSFNPIEGLKLRLGGRTTPALSKRYYFETYAAYGFKDQKWKGFLSATYSINDKSIYKFPQDYVRASVEYDTHIPGENLQFVQEDNFLLSFKRGVNDKYLYDFNYRVDYVHEYENHFSYKFGLSRLNQSPAGSLYFNTVDDNGAPVSIHNLITSEITGQLRYAPNEQFYQGKIYRVPIPNRYPVFTLDYAEGIKNVLGGTYNYQKLHGEIDKRFYLSQFGFADITVEASKLFGQVPYPLLNIFRANQTYAYDLYSYNLMNFLEFVSDHNESISIDQHFAGFFFNKIPLFKKLKWREVASFKAIYGGLSDNNNPSLHPNLYQFPVTATGVPITYALGKTPYMEASVGIENIFKFVRVDLVHRLSYLNNPNVAPWGIRTRVQFDF